MPSILLRILRLSSILLLLFSAPAYTHHLKIDNARIHEGPPSQKVLAAYLTAINDSDVPIEIIALESPLFERLEIHQTVIENELARMQLMHSIPVKANSSVALSPGGMHLMLITPSQRIKAGTYVPVTFILADGHRFDIEIPVIKAHDTHHHNHH